MKTSRLFFLLAILLTLGLQSCLKDNCDRTVSYIQLEPVYKTLNEIHEGTVVQEAPRTLQNPGQFYYYNDQIFVNERGEGIHQIDNSDPSNPVIINFLAIPGNEDIAIKNGVLYANTYIDLLAIDLQSFQLLGRVESVFAPIWQDLANNQILVDYREMPITEVMDCETFSTLRRQGETFFRGEDVLIDVAFNDFASINESSSQGNSAADMVGIGGSMARFTIMGNYLYAIDESGMDLFDLGQPNQPTEVGRVEIGWGIETIFPYEDKLFIGSNNGMFIYDNSVPTQPVQLSAFAHATSCDPVFVDGNYAYVTLRSGNNCQGFINQLDLIDITSLTSPVLKRTFPMENPHGLSIRDNKLFLCEGDAGLKSFDITNPETLGDHLLDHEKGVHAFDAISLPGNDNVVMIIGDDGFYQYSCDEAGQLKLLSKISISR